MARFLAGVAACLLLVTGAFLLWQSHAEKTSSLPPAPLRLAGVGDSDPDADEGPVEAPEATAKSREEKRFSRADKDKDGKIEKEELLGARRKAFAKLDKNGDGNLAFDEWAAKTIDKFSGADRDRSGWLSPAEYATTAPPRPKKKRCSC